ncbi:unnamed protein product [Trichobilharzia regenti]|nr:unnamed protein product [Trichobilharzia regenti]
MYPYRYSSSSSSASSEEEDYDVYAPDDSDSGRINHPSKREIDPRSGKVINISRETPEDYCKLISVKLFDFYTVSF